MIQAAEITTTPLCIVEVDARQNPIGFLACQGAVVVSGTKEKGTSCGKVTAKRCKSRRMRVCESTDVL